MAIAPIWLTKAGDLGIISGEAYYELQFDAYNPLGGTLTYSVVTGSLPTGLTLSSTGLLSGVPAGASKITENEFTVRVKNNENKVADRTFILSIGGLVPPVLLPESSSLGYFEDGSKVDIQLHVVESNKSLQPVFSIIAGELPPGLTLSPDGKIYGYIKPIQGLGIYGPLDGPLFTLYSSLTPKYGPDFDWTNPDDPFFKIGFDEAGFDSSGESYVSKNFQFTVQVTDGAGSDAETYTLFVLAGQVITADITDITADQTLPTVDQISITTTGPRIYNPVIYTLPGNLGIVTKDSNLAFQILAEDFNKDTLEYTAWTKPGQTGLPAGIDFANKVAGNPQYAYGNWLVGSTDIDAQAGVYSFTVRVRKRPGDTGDTYYYSNDVEFSLTILGEDTLIWNSPSNLGTIYTGDISKLHVDAYTVNGQDLVYKLKTPGTLPIGLELKSDGTLSGRVSFQIFDTNGQITTEDQTYTFTISVGNNDLTIYEERTFFVKVVSTDAQPYENLYAQLLPTRDQRDLFYNILNNDVIFPSDNLYRPMDSWFGKNTGRRLLLQAGLNPQQASAYVSAMTYNHYDKEIQFGDVRTAIAVNSNFEVEYEVVYLEIVDSFAKSLSNTQSLSINWPINSASITTVYPNSFNNMSTRITDSIGYQNRGTIPDWMNSRQEDGTVPGFVQAFVLCYAKPGKSAEIAYKINQIISSFGRFRFTIDRYLWDHGLSGNYDKTANTFIANNYINGTGLIEGAENSPYITGYDTTFTSEIFVNDQILIYSPVAEKNNKLLGTVKTIHNDGNLELYANCSITTWETVQQPHSFAHLIKDEYIDPGAADQYLKFPRTGILS